MQKVYEVIYFIFPLTFQNILTELSTTYEEFKI